MSSRSLEGKHFGVVRELQNQYAESVSPGIPKEHLERIQARVKELMPGLMAWRERFPAIVASRLKSATLGCVASDPGARMEQHLLISQVGLLVFAVDDVADGEIGSLSDEEIHRVLARYAETVRAPESQSWTGSDEAECVGGAVQDVARSLHRLPGAKRFLALWQEHFRRMCEAHSTELRDKRRAQREGALPTLEHYLDVSRWTCGPPMYHSAALVVLGPDYAGDPLQEPLLERALVEMSLLGRWMNDVRSLERERAEGKFNGLSLLVAGGMSEAEAERFAVERAGRHLESLQEIVARLPEPLRPWGRTLIATGHFSRMFYMRREFHHLESGG
uniref:Terpene synthase family protein n=1 Tax=Vitiosangium cumulatum TaxID=1867796 RepID=A0A7D4XMB2_9BACT|nr:terpene synthase family protein [Vitiosangium cumulatum]